MKRMDIFLCGVGGQGIGLMADVLGRICLAAGYRVRGSDTHGIAQRHGSVVSHLRLGGELFAPVVPPGQADLVVGLERLEALRGAAGMLAPGGTVVYYDTVYQPIHVRMGRLEYPAAGELADVVAEKSGRLERVVVADLERPQMQNVALLGRLVAIEALEGVTAAIAETALAEALPAKLLEENLAVFRRALEAESE